MLSSAPVRPQDSSLSEINPTWSQEKEIQPHQSTKQCNSGFWKCHHLPVLSLQLTRKTSGYPCLPRRSCLHRQLLVYSAGHCMYTGLQGSCCLVWEMAPGEQEGVVQCYCFCHLKAVRWPSTHHHKGQSDLYCWTLSPKRGGADNGASNFSVSFCSILVDLESITLYKAMHKISLSHSRKQ